MLADAPATSGCGGDGMPDWLFWIFVLSHGGAGVAMLYVLAAVLVNRTTLIARDDGTLTSLTGPLPCLGRRQC